MSLLGASTALALFLTLCYVPGWVVARGGRMPLDAFGRLWVGVAICSAVGLVLGEYGWFSLVSVAVAAALVTALTVVAARLLPTAATPAGTPEVSAPRAVRALAGASALVLVVWSWPPFETVIAASDSTMYVNAGLYLAHTGGFAVRETIASALPPDAARTIFSSVGWGGAGPFIRLPGGLLMETLDAGYAKPAFFPLLSIWTGILGAAGGATSSVLVAPLFSALAVWAIVLFAGETFGLAAAGMTAAMLIANFACWWYAKLTMPEPLAAAALWGGLVLLQRAARRRDARLAVLTGAVFGIAGLARNETLLFLGSALVITWAWTRMRVSFAGVMAGLAPLVGVAVFVAQRSPSHHLAYLHNDLVLPYLAIVPRLIAYPRSVRAAIALVLLLVMVAAVRGRRSGLGVVRGVFRFVAPLAVLAAVVVYVRIGNLVFPVRDLSWLAAYCSWPLVAAAALALPAVWRRDGEAVRVGAVLWLLETVVFGLNPRVSAYQPWAIRRFLPVVIPGVTIAGAAGLAWLATRGRAARALAAVTVLAVLCLEGRAILPARARSYYEGSFAAVAALGERLPADAIVGFDGDLADAQLQVPLWLMTGRETLVLSEGGHRWRDVMRALAATGRPVVWIGQRLGSRSDMRGVALQPLPPDPDVVVLVPDTPADIPPSIGVTRDLPLRLYGVGTGDGSVAGSMPFTRAQSSRETTSMISSTCDHSPLLSVLLTNTW